MENKTSDEATILFSELEGAGGSLGLITLNRQSVLNALNHHMFSELNRQILAWDEAPHIKAVVITAAPGRAFCAGGDIRTAWEIGKKNPDLLPAYFGTEYQMNKCIYHFSKPYIALMDGICMGGGAGISIYGSYRAATQEFTFAMPETGIGFFPDIGASYFLTRLPKKMGLYLGLTGVTIPYNDCLALGLIDVVITPDSISKIITDLQNTSLQNHSDATVAEIIRKYSKLAPESELMQHQGEIETCFSKNTIEDITETLIRYPGAWCEKTANLLALKSPTSLKVTLRELQEGARLSFDDCMKMEFRLMNRFIREPDFYEGVRAAIIDKDHKPKWQPMNIADVSQKKVAEFFAPLDKELH
jgi:enoyl-CoA hydratase